MTCFCCFIALRWFFDGASVKSGGKKPPFTLAWALFSPPGGKWFECFKTGPCITLDPPNSSRKASKQPVETASTFWMAERRYLQDNCSKAAPK